MQFFCHLINFIPHLKAAVFIRIHEIQWDVRRESVNYTFATLVSFVHMDSHNLMNKPNPNPKTKPNHPKTTTSLQ